MEAVAIAVKKAAIRCRIVSTRQPVTFRIVRREVEGEILTIIPSKVWRYQNTHYMTGEVLSEGMVIEQIVTMMSRWRPSFLRTPNGAEIDLIMEKGNRIRVF
ncbi:MAG: hypothetical protein GQ565_03865 [Candidatus Aegiribacteria sp.]|nr:hypothetical protein [Candidatus Aegiribacteria sp.]